MRSGDHHGDYNGEYNRGMKISVYDIAQDASWGVATYQETGEGGCELGTGYDGFELGTGSVGPRSCSRLGPESKYAASERSCRGRHQPRTKTRRKYHGQPNIPDSDVDIPDSDVDKGTPGGESRNGRGKGSSGRFCRGRGRCRIYPGRWTSRIGSSG